jgi:hypothetical protein
MCGTVRRTSQWLQGGAGSPCNKWPFIDECGQSKAVEVITWPVHMELWEGRHTLLTTLSVVIT